jgi:hypothetical protein
MSKYKMDAQQVRARVESIGRNFSSRGVNKVLEAEILTLLEDATGEKLPELFDERRVEHGSVWLVRNLPFSRRLILVQTGSSTSYLPEFVFVVVDGAAEFYDERAGVLSKSEAKTKCARMTYLGQYDFTAGLPK